MAGLFSSVPASLGCHLEKGAAAAARGPTAQGTASECRRRSRGNSRRRDRGLSVSRRRAVGSDASSEVNEAHLVLSLKVVGRPRFELGTFAVSELDEANLDVLTMLEGRVRDGPTPRNGGLDDRPIRGPPSKPPFMLSMGKHYSLPALIRRLTRGAHCALLIK